MERIVSIHAMYTVLTRLVTESMVVVCLVVKKMKTVVRIYPTNFLNFYRKCILCTFEKSKLSMKAVVFNSMNYLYEDLKLFSFLFFSYYKKYKIITVSIGHPATVGGTVGISVIVVIGIIFAMFVARYDNKMNASAEKKTTI